MDKTTINPKDVFLTIDENLKALSQINYDELSKEEVAEMKEKYEMLIEMALKLKKKFK